VGDNLIAGELSTQCKQLGPRITAASPRRAQIPNVKEHDEAGRHIEVHFAGETQAIVVDVADGGDSDQIADALVTCLDARDVDDAEGRLHETLGANGSSVRRGP
jgi:hypothetical protein